MALRTFSSNPALGGFGGESTDLLLNDELGLVSTRGSDGDAISQIIKELVDNAVDACGYSVDGASKTPKRVRVEIQQFRGAIQRSVSDEVKSDRGNTNDGELGEILRITVTDNGCGMRDIQSCVNAFHTSKAHATQETCAGEKTDGSNSMLSYEAHTAGRYGIGLTLCLLHAQRLVPGSCALVRSATSEKADWSTVKCVVDTEGDSIECAPSASIPKNAASESGTSVSLLVPGGVGASLAWPRIAEYFARFKLSLGMKCSLEVLAPTLSRVPLFIRPPVQTNEVENDDNDVQDEHSWVDGLDDEIGGFQVTTPKASVQAGALANSNDDERTQIWKAAQLYLGRSFDESNVAHAVVPIRIQSRLSETLDTSRPKLEVFLIVHGPGDEEREDIGQLVGDSDTEWNDHEQDTSRTASMVLVRMVNRIPLLDSSEAVACGLVQSIPSKKRMWNSFGLDASQNSSSSAAKLLCFDLRDSEQVAPFFRLGNHALLEEEDDDEGESESGSLNEENVSGGEKRKRRTGLRRVLPASVRLGNVLLVVQIHAQPSTLPLPTLSKGRLPVDNPAIENAMEVALSQCLRQLQTTNPDLLLTAGELKSVEQDARYIPATSSAMSSILCKSNSDVQSVMQKISLWGISGDGVDEESRIRTTHGVSQQVQMESIGQCLESRFRLVLANGGRKKKQRSDRRDDESQYDTEEALGADTFASSLDHELPREVSPTWHSQSPCRREDSTEVPSDEDASKFDAFEEW